MATIVPTAKPTAGSTRARAMLKVSLAINLGLLGVVWHQAADAKRATRAAPDAPARSALTLAAPAAAERFAPRLTPNPAASPPFNWSQVESGDYRAYIANLRRIGCPERTVREIIAADVADLYAGKRRELGLGASGPTTGPWSRQEEDALVGALFAEQPGTNDNSRQLADNDAGAGAASLPLIFQTQALGSLDLSDEQRADLDWLRNEFVREIGGLNQDTNDPGYLQRWQKAQPKVDELLIGVIGRKGIVELDQALH